MCVCLEAELQKKKDIVNERDKLKKDYEKLGLFKVEHIFTEVYVKSAEKWIGKNEDGTYFYHMSKKLKDICSKSDDPMEELRRSPPSVL